MQFGKPRYRNVIQIMVKWVGVYRLAVMRRKPNHYPAGMYGPKPDFTTRQTIVGTAVFAALLLAAVFAMAYPVAVAGVLVGALVVRRGVRAAGRLRQRRRMEGRARHVCIPMIGVCVEA